MTGNLVQFRATAEELEFFRKRRLKLNEEAHSALEQRMRSIAWQEAMKLSKRHPPAKEMTVEQAVSALQEDKDELRRRR